MAEELESHIQMHVDDAVRAGMTTEEARREAVRKLGGLEPTVREISFDKDDELGENLQVVVWDDNLAAYGWLWLIIGVLLILAGIGVWRGSEWARWFGIGMAAISAITSFLWIYAFPIWALVSSMISFLVIYALAAYGGRSVDEVG